MFVFIFFLFLLRNFKNVAGTKTEPVMFYLKIVDSDFFGTTYN